jgi:DNA topoisomerase-3
MKVVLAEKPSVARDIAAVVGATNKRDGYFEGNDYIVTYAFGHLVTIAEPEDMNPAWGKPWRIQQLPMIPSEWKYRVADKASAQFKVIKKHFNDPSTSSIICATDAGREGENIFRLIYKLTGTKRPVQRLWISSLTPEAIRDGFRKLRPSRDYDALANAAAGRAHADWIVGLNFTRAYTTINNQLCTVGRVQTPTLALIVQRQEMIDKFKSTAFFEILVTFEPGFVARYITPGAQPQTRLQDKAQAQAVIDSIALKQSGTVSSVSTMEKKTKAPPLFDLLTLQKEANKRFGYTAQETLDIAQSLYEEYKLISYPRTESRHISTDMIEELPGILTTVLKSQMTDKAVRDALAREGFTPGNITTSMLRPCLDKTYVDDTKLTDHHAIIPTNKAVTANLPDRQLNVYKLVATRFLSIFLPPEIRDETTVVITMAEHSFRARGVVIKQIGWTVVEPRAAKKEKDEPEESQPLPSLTKGQQVAKRKQELKEGKTSAPKPYDDASLLTAMKNAGQELDDEDLASYMKQRGLGTPATRAAIIERLLQSGYIERSKKTLIPTAKGRALIGYMHADLKDTRLTAAWEQRLADMQDGNLPLEIFESEIASFVRRLLSEVIKQPAALLAATAGSGGFGPCPQCKQGMVRETPKGAGCSRWKEGCKFTIWREQYGKKLTPAQMQELAEKGRTKLIKGFKRKDGSGTYAAHLFLADDFRVRIEIPSDQGSSSDGGFGVCPQCRTGIVRQTPKGAGCSRWKEGCSFSIWRQQYGKELTDAQIKELVVTGQTKEIKGFKKKDGSGTYDARLAITTDFKVRPKFDSVGNS